LTRGLLRLALLAVLLFASFTHLDQGSCPEKLRHEGDLILEGDEILVISNCVLEVTGGIYVRDNATLRLENVDVRFIDTNDELWHLFKAEENSTIILSKVRCRVEIQVYDTAKLTAIDSTLYRSWYCTIHGYNHTAGGVYAYQDSQMRLDNCRIGYVTTRRNAKAEITGSTVARAWPNGSEMTLIDSTVDIQWETIEGFNGSLSLTEESLKDMDPGSVLPGSKTTFRNVHVNELWLSLIESNITITDSQLEYLFAYNDTRLNLENSVINGLYMYGESVEVSVERSTVEQVRSAGLGSNFMLKISRSRIGEIGLEFCIVSLEVTESTIESLNVDNFWAQTSGINVSDSIIGTFKPGFGETVPIHYRFSNVTIRDSMDFKYGAFEDSGGAVITGDIRFGPDFKINKTTVDMYALITRLYNVRVTEGYVPKGGAKLTLLRGNQTLWTGETDEEGKATFPVRHAHIFVVIRPTTPITPTVIQVNNVTDTLKLRVGEGKSSVELNVGLMTDTPITVNLTKNYEYGLYTLPVIIATIGLYLVIIVKKRLVRGQPINQLISCACFVARLPGLPALDGADRQANFRVTRSRSFLGLTKMS
jgi:hypothetical protein